MTETLVDWLRAELEADRQAAAEKSIGDWLITGVDTIVALGLFARTCIYACVYAVNYGEGEAPIAFSLADEPLEAEWWGFVDKLQASLLGPIVVGFVIEAHQVGSMPAAWFAFLALNAAVLVLDPLRVIGAEVSR